jgi:hypothetical protein
MQAPARPCARQLASLEQQQQQCYCFEPTRVAGHSVCRTLTQLSLSNVLIMYGNEKACMSIKKKHV